MEFQTLSSSEARKLVINSELISTGDLSMPADEDAPIADFLIGS